MAKKKKETKAKKNTKTTQKTKTKQKQQETPEKCGLCGSPLSMYNKTGQCYHHSENPDANGTDRSGSMQVGCSHNSYSSYGR